MSPSTLDKAPTPNARAILQDCRGIAARRLPALIYEVLKQIKADLMEIAPSTQKYELFALYREALDITQGRWSLIESRFRTHFLDRFDQESRHAAPAAPASPSVARHDDFKLMEADDLEESLAANTIANAIKSVCVDDLMTLNPRLGSLLKDPDFLHGHNPLGPEVIGEALMETLQELEGSIKSKLVLVPMFSKYFPKRVQTVYQEINQHLYNKGVLPALPVHKHKAHPEKESEPSDKSAASPGKDMRGKAAQSPPQDLFAMLQQLMTLGRIGDAQPQARGDGPATRTGMTLSGDTPQRAPAAASGHGAAPGIPTLPGGFPEPPARVGLYDSALSELGQQDEPQAIFLNQLTRIQHGEAEDLVAQGLQVADTRDGRVNVLHTLRQSDSAHELSQIDSMTLDIVALLFDFILDDRRIPDAMKALIGRLQIPLLKVALVDKSLFANKTHPARQVLDTLAKAAMGWNAEEGHESNLYQKINALVQRIMKEFTDDTSLFQEILVDLQGFIESEQAAATDLAVKAAQQIHAREQVEKPRLVAREEIQRRLEFQALPKLVRRFLNESWEPLLVKIYTSQGQESETWIKAITTMDDLVWSVTPKNHSQDRKKLLVILPKLLKWLDQGLQFLGIPQSQREPFFTELVKYHTEAVRPGLDDADFAKAFDIAVGRPGDVKPVVEEANDFEFVEAPVEADVAPDPVLIQEIVQTPEPEQEEIVIGDVTWASSDFEQEIAQGRRDVSDYELLVKNMKRGAWIEVDQDNGESMRAKLAWVSPLRGVYLFTNRLGQKAISISAGGLAAKFRDGRVRLIDNVPLMDRAVSGLIGRLQKTTR